jgi:hypothetical protein
MLIVYVATGLVFMLLPGTFVGVLTLLKISSAQTPGAAEAGWIQAHGHAQIFGWLGTFILGIGYYAIPRLRLSRFSHAAAWTTYGLWTTGVALRWAIGSWPWEWRTLFPLAAALELSAVAIFAASVFLVRPRAAERSWRTSIAIITAAGAGMAAAVLMNFRESVVVALHGSAPVFPASFNQKFLVVATWGFVVPFVWGFSSRWLPPLLGLRATRKPMLLGALLILLSGVAAAMGGHHAQSSVLLLASAILFSSGLRMFEPGTKEPKLRGVHAYTPQFIRLAYGWLIVAAALGIVASASGAQGYAGASRHALTVGFFAAAVFTIGPRVLPAFFNARHLWSTRVMAASLVLLNIGCATRVLAQILAYVKSSGAAWSALPLSAIVEMTAVTLFALNMIMTLTTGSPLEAFLESQRRSQAAGEA